MKLLSADRPIKNLMRGHDLLEPRALGGRLHRRLGAGARSRPRGRGLGGARVILLEEGGSFTRKADFHMQEAEAYPKLYQTTAPRDGRPRDHDPPGARRRRRNARELDDVLPDAGGDALPVARAPRPRGLHGGTLRPPLGRGREAPQHPRGRRVGGQREQRRPPRGSEEARDPDGVPEAQRHVVHAHRLLRNGLPDEREARDGPDVPARRGGEGRPRLRGLPGRAPRPRRAERARHERRGRGARSRDGPADRPPRDRRGDAVRRSGRRDQFAGSPPALRRAGPRGAHRPPHVPAPRRRDHRDLRAARRPVLRRPSVGRLARVHRTSGPDGLLPRGAAAPPDARRDRDAGFRRSAPGRHEEPLAHERDHRALRDGFLPDDEGDGLPARNGRRLSIATRWATRTRRRCARR